MKNTFKIIAVVITFIITLTLLSCETENAKVEETGITINGQKFKSVQMGQCEYMYYWAGGYGGMLGHQGDCKFCQKRLVRTIDSIVKANK